MFLGLFVLAIWYWRAHTPDALVVRRVFGGEQTLVTFKAAQTVTAQRLRFRSEHPKSSWQLDSYEHEAPVVVAPGQARELHRLLVQGSSYKWDTAKRCAPNYGVLITFHAGQQVVRVALCFECNTIGVYNTSDDTASRVNREEDVDPIRPSLVAIAKFVFPADSAIQALK